MNPLQQASIFILETILGLFIIALILRFMLQAFRADFRNPIYEVISKVTNPVVLPLRRIIPGLFKLDMATLVAVFIFSLLKTLLVIFLSSASTYLDLSLALFLYVLGDIIDTAINIATVAIIAQAIMSWFSPSPHHPGVQFVHSLANPINRPARRIMPSFSGLDISPILTLMGLYLIRILIVSPLMGISSY